MSSLLQITKAVASLAACVSFITPAIQAAPVAMTSSLAQRTSSGAKRIVLWEYTNTAAIESGNCGSLETTAQSLSSSSKISFAANWETWAPSELPSDITFSPTVATRAHLSGEKWTQLMTSLEGKENAIVQFYNEPELNGIDATTAAADWRNVMLKLKETHGVKLVGPGCASNDKGSAWLEEFMGLLADNEKPDFLGLHFYTNKDSPCATEIQAAKTYLQGKHDQYGLDCVVNEIASTSRDMTQVKDFTESMADWMDEEAQSWIHAYGFKGVAREPSDDYVSPQAQLLNSNGDWTDLGKWLNL